MSFLSLILALVLPRMVHGGFSCLGEDGQPVDWFLAYKLPRLEDSEFDLVKEGFAYAYLDPLRDTFKLSKQDVRSVDSAPGSTLKQVYDQVAQGKNDFGYIFYDDEDPSGHEYFHYGHTKGDIAFDMQGGFWLIHSVPRMPPNATESYEYPSSGGRYGQHFLCVTFNASAFDQIGLQLRYNDPHIHSKALPSSMESKYPNIVKLFNDENIRSSPFHNYVKLVSQGGLAFHSFAKTSEFGADLYHALVAPTLQSNLLAETWLHSREAIGPSCDGYTVEDISQLRVITSVATFSFSNEDDHSKYAIGKSPDAPFVCVGDINRVESQYERGGGTLCLENSDIWKKYRTMVVEINGCKSKNSLL